MAIDEQIERLTRETQFFASRDFVSADEENKNVKVDWINLSHASDEIREQAYDFLCKLGGVFVGEPGYLVVDGHNVLMPLGKTFPGTYYLRYLDDAKAYKKHCCNNRGRIFGEVKEE